MSVVNTPELKNIEGVMTDLLRQLQQLAPHPDRPDHNGPLFVIIDPSRKPAAEYDSMLGSMALDSMLGTAFSQAASENFGSWTKNIDWSNSIEASSYFVQDRTASNNNFQLGQRHSISGAFNESVQRDALMEAFLRDLPRRMGIERSLAVYQRKVYSLRKLAAQRAFAFAA